MKMWISNNEDSTCPIRARDLITQGWVQMKIKGQRRCVVGTVNKQSKLNIWVVAFLPLAPSIAPPILRLLADLIDLLNNQRSINLPLVMER